MEDLIKQINNYPLPGCRFSFTGSRSLMRRAPSTSNFLHMIMRPLPSLVPQTNKWFTSFTQIANSLATFSSTHISHTLVAPSLAQRNPFQWLSTMQQPNHYPGCCMVQPCGNNPCMPCMHAPFNNISMPATRSPTSKSGNRFPAAHSVYLPQAPLPSAVSPTNSSAC
jgi:hypothetical protein